MDRHQMIEQIFADVQREHLRAEGEEKGLREGMLRGELRATRLLLYLLLQHRIKSVPSVVSNYIDYINDPERLQTAFRHALTIEKLEDLRI